MSFKNVFNQEISQEGLVEDLISYYQELNVENKTKITDFSEGSEARTLIEVLAHLAYNLLEEQNNTLANHFINTAEGEYLDLLGSNPNVSLPRQTGGTARGLVRFALPGSATETITIPADTVVSGDDLEFVTLEDTSISVGETYTYVNVESVLDGSVGNVTVGTIDTCELTGFIVTNEEPLVGGFDFEEDDTYRLRLLDYVREDNFGSRGWYESTILNFDGVHDIKEITDTTITTDTIAYYVNTNNATNNQSIVNEITSFFSNNSNYVVGHSRYFIPPTYTNVTITITQEQDSEYSFDDLKDLLECYFRGGEVQDYPIFLDGLSMGESVTSSDVNSMIEEKFDGIDVTTADKQYTISYTGLTTLQGNGAYNLSVVLNDDS